MASSGWLPEGEGAFCLHPAGVKIPLPGKTKQNVLSNATDRWFFLPSVMTTHIIKFYQLMTFIIALFTVTRTRTQPRCPSTDDWIKNLWNIYTMEYYSTIKIMDLSQF